MAQWANTLDIADVWAKAYVGEITPPEFCRLVANKLKAMVFKTEYAYMSACRDELAEAFMDYYEEYKDDPDAAEYDDVDHLLCDLYDWGDEVVDSTGGFFNTVKTCWINK